MKVSCPKCENVCSDKTPSCPKCGHPLQEMAPSEPTPIELLANAAKAGQQPVEVRPVQVVQTIEKPARKWKRAVLPAIATCLLGVAMYSAGVYDPKDEPSAMSTMGAVLALAGLVGVIVAKVGAWRHHG